MHYVSLTTCKGPYRLYLHNIIRIQSSSNYSRIYFADKRHPLTVAKVLHWFEDNLPADKFLRTHRTHLVNREYIRSVSISSQSMQLSNGEKISISKRRKNSVKEKLCA